MEKYLWELKEQEKEPTLDKNLETDILIIGGGLTGISCAFNLKDSNYNITVVDQGMCGHGATLRTTAKLTYLQEDLYSKITNIYGTNKAKLYLKSQQDAIKIAKDNIEKYNIDCDLEDVDSYIFIMNLENQEKLNKEKNILKEIGQIEEKENIPIDFPCRKSIKGNSTAVFHPLKYLLALKEICKKNNISFYENTMVKKIKKEKDYYLIDANEYKIKAKIVIACCHYPFFVIPGWIPFKTHLEKSYIGATPISDVKKFSAINLDNDIYSFRYHSDRKENYLIFLSETHKLSDEFDHQIKIDNLNQKIEASLNEKPKYLWSNYDLITDDFLPFIGKINNNHPNLYLATGFNTWGMTNGILSGKIISDLILEKENLYTELFRPDRPINIKKLGNDIVDSFNSSKALIKTKLKKNYAFYPEQVEITEKNGKSIGIFKDKEGKKHAVSLLCPHMKCSLIFNPVIKSWDCPCHGSRFDIDGNVLKGPSCDPIKVDLD